MFNSLCSVGYCISHSAERKATAIYHQYLNN